ncbi:MAG: glucose-6-phosphate isomerase [Ignavibacteriae bacterium]|nr:MAG: glucose-6-phosphate isomerase [Ignavibacteriota bacterium]
MSAKNVNLFLNNYELTVNQKYNKYVDDKISERIFNKDYTVWADSPTEITNRLDWLFSSEETASKINEINDFVQDIKQNGFTDVLLLGMGGSSLAPEVFSLSFGNKTDYLNLSILDSTDPDRIYELTENIDLEKTLFIVSTKSGGTIETLSFFKYFYTVCSKKLNKENAGNQFVAITDPNSGLEKLAKELNFRKIFLNNPNIGGRYSVLSLFGIVPAALLGIDIEKLLNRAKNVAIECKETKSNSGKIGVAIGRLAMQGINKLTFIYSKKIISFGTWVEQLVAESTGKNGVGILPIENEKLEESEYYKNDRIFVYTHFADDQTENAKIEKLKAKGFPVIEIVLEDIYDLGTEFFRWEYATAVAGWAMGIQPFDQPNVESAKVEAKAMIKNYVENNELPKLNYSIENENIKLAGKVENNSLSEAIKEFLENLNNTDSADYVAIQAYISSNSETNNELQKLRTKIQKKYKTAVTVGYGPRFLHSTGQLHKGDSGKGLFIQFISDRKHKIEIPKEAGKEESEFTFGVLINAQLLGDREALLKNNRKIITLNLGNDLVNNLQKIIVMI